MVIPGVRTGRECASRTTSGDGGTVGIPSLDRASALCAGACVPGGGKIASGGKHRAPLAPDCPGGRSGRESIFCPLVTGGRELRVEQAGCCSVPLLSHHRQSAPGAFLGGAGRAVWPGISLSSPRR